MTAACSEESTTSIPPIIDPDTPTDLDLTFPRLTREHRMQGERVEIAPSPGPAAVITDGGPMAPDDTEAAILSAKTDVGFTADYAYSAGRQRYTGNRGRVETTAFVTYNGTPIGTQPAMKEEYVPFLLDFGSIKELVVEAYVFIDRDCGLKVDGNSMHFSGWEWFLGATAPNWGPSGESSQAFPPQSQPACVEEAPEPATGGTGSAEFSGIEGYPPVACWYWVTYVPYSGVIYDADFLYCDDAMTAG
jgi:hypothetical protein